MGTWNKHAAFWNNPTRPLPDESGRLPDTGAARNTNSPSLTGQTAVRRHIRHGRPGPECHNMTSRADCLDFAVSVLISRVINLPAPAPRIVDGELVVHERRVPEVLLAAGNSPPILVSNSIFRVHTSWLVNFASHCQLLVTSRLWPGPSPSCPSQDVF